MISVFNSVFSNQHFSACGNKRFEFSTTDFQYSISWYVIRPKIMGSALLNKLSEMLMCFVVRDHRRVVAKPVKCHIDRGN